MKNLCKSVLALWVIGMGLGVSALAQAASGVGPYYAMPAWDQTYPAATRFIVLTNMNSEAVLDRETGVVWEQSPSTNDGIVSWVVAQIHCINLNKGGRTGWRLPSIQELTSLVDLSMTNPSLPSGHPFSNVQDVTFTTGYWSSTGYYTDGGTSAWRVSPNGDVNPVLKSQSNYAWCVRGGSVADGQ